MSQRIINISHEKLLAKLDQVVALAKQISRESALFHKEHNHKGKEAHYEQKNY